MIEPRARVEGDSTERSLARTGQLLEKLAYGFAVLALARTGGKDLLFALQPAFAGPLALAAIYGLSCVATGFAILRILGLKKDRTAADLSLAEYLGSGLILGQGVLGVVWQTLAVFRVFTPWIVGAVLLFFLIAGAYVARGLARPLLASVRDVGRELRHEPPVWKLAAGLIATLSVWTMVLTWQPGAGDGLAFYMAQPKLIASTGRFVPVPSYTTFSHIGLGSEMHFAVGYLFEGERTAKTLTWTAFWGIALVLWALAGRFGMGLRGKLTVVGMLLTSTSALNLIGDGKTDLFPAALGVTAALWAFRVGTLSPALAVTGLLSGLAMTGKLSYPPVLVPLIAGTAGWSVWRSTEALNRRARYLRLLSAAAACGGWVIVGVLPLVLKNAVALHEPLAPFVYRDPVWKKAAAALVGQSWFSPWNTAWIVATYPLALVFGDYPMQHGSISSLLLAFSPLALLRKRNDRLVETPRALMVLTLSAAIAVAIWVILKPAVLAPRYIFPPLLLLFPFAASHAERVSKDVALVLLPKLIPWSLVAGLLMTFSLYQRPHWDGIQTSMHPPEAISCYEATGRIVNEVLRPGERWALAMFYRSMFRPDLLQCSFGDEELPIGRPSSSCELWEELHVRGARALVLDKTTRAPKFTVDPLQTPRWLTVTEEKVNEDISVFFLHPRPGAPSPRATCVEESPGLWVRTEAPRKK